MTEQIIVLTITVSDDAHVCPECECCVCFTSDVIQSVSLDIICPVCHEPLVVQSDTLAFGRQ